MQLGTFGFRPGVRTLEGVEAAEVEQRQIDAVVHVVENVEVARPNPKVSLSNLVQF
jgi:hypothetical protein